MAIHADARELARRWFEEVWNARHDRAVDELMATDAVGYVEGGNEVRGPDGFRQMRDTFVGALPDVHIEIEDIVADGDRAAVRWRARGTHRGDHLGIRASHRAIDVRGTTWLLTRDGKIVGGFDTWNLGALLASLQE